MQWKSARDLRLLKRRRCSRASFLLVLSGSLNKLDIAKLNDLANVNVDNLRKLSGVFQQPVGIANTVVQPTRTQTTGQPGMQSPNSDTAVTNKKL